MATTLPWLPGWPAVRPRRRAAGAPAIPAPSGPPLARGERPLITAAGVVATGRALYHRAGGALFVGGSLVVEGSRGGGDVGPGPSVDGRGPAAGEWVRLGWEQAVRADPHERGLVLTAWAPGLPARTVVAARRAAPLLALARERIAWTTLLTTRLPIAGCPARVVARRTPASGELFWIVTLDPALRMTAAVEAELVAALTRLRREFSPA
jgi:hypothetical protein